MFIIQKMKVDLHFHIYSPFCKYSLSMNSTGLNLTRQIIRGFFFSMVNPTVLHNTQMAESVDSEQPLLQRTSYKLYTDSRLQGGSEPLISTPVGSRVNCIQINSSQRMVGNLLAFFLTVVKFFQMGI